MKFVFINFMAKSNNIKEKENKCIKKVICIFFFLNKTKTNNYKFIHVFCVYIAWATNVTQSLYRPDMMRNVKFKDLSGQRTRSRQIFKLGQEEEKYKSCTCCIVPRFKVKNYCWQRQPI